MHIRKATKADTKDVAVLFDMYRVFYEKESDQEAAIRFISERIEQGDSVIFVADIDGALVGFTQLYPLFSSTQMKRLWLLNDLFVHPEARAKGISKALIEVAKSLAIRSKSAGLMLETTKTNKIGNQLYPKTGFELDTVHNYYSWDTKDI